jgi:hypothetical protein
MIDIQQSLHWNQTPSTPWSGFSYLSPLSITNTADTDAIMNMQPIEQILVQTACLIAFRALVNISPLKSNQYIKPDLLLVAATVIASNTAVTTLLDDPATQAVISTAGHQLFSFATGCLTQVRKGLDALKPYQGRIAGMQILGRVGWEVKKQITVTDNEKQLARIGALKEILKKQPHNTALKTRIENLETFKKERDLIHKRACLSVCDLASLVFDHPGKNIWKACTNLAGRALSLKTVIQSLKCPSLREVSISCSARAAISTIATVGTSAALAAQAGLVNGQDPTVQALTQAAFAISLTEMGITAKNWIASKIWRPAAV